jgi:hypothetical protein
MTPLEKKTNISTLAIRKHNNTTMIATNPTLNILETS